MENMAEAEEAERGGVGTGGLNRRRRRSLFIPVSYKVGLYKLNSLDPYLESAPGWYFNPFAYE